MFTKSFYIFIASYRDWKTTYVHQKTLLTKPQNASTAQILDQLYLFFLSEMFSSSLPNYFLWSVRCLNYIFLHEIPCLRYGAP